METDSVIGSRVYCSVLDAAVEAAHIALKVGENVQLSAKCQHLDLSDQVKIRPGVLGSANSGPFPRRLSAACCSGHLFRHLSSSSIVGCIDTHLNQSFGGKNRYSKTKMSLIATKPLSLTRSTSVLAVFVTIASWDEDNYQRRFSTGNFSGWKASHKQS